MSENTSKRSMQPGDLVQLKSGGPAMTLVSAEQPNAMCMWFDAQEKRDLQLFPLHVLRPYKAPSDGTWSLAAIERRGADKI